MNPADIALLLNIEKNVALKLSAIGDTDFTTFNIYSKIVEEECNRAGISKDTFLKIKRDFNKLNYMDYGN